MRKSLWSPDEDQKLKQYVTKHGCGNWSEVAKNTGLQRCGKSCRLRWINYLRPELKRGPFSLDEIRLIVNLHRQFGNSWSKMATYLPGRTDNDIKNFWHTYTRSARLQQADRQKLEQTKALSADNRADQCNTIPIATSETLVSGNSSIVSQYRSFLQHVATIQKNVQQDSMGVSTGCGLQGTYTDDTISACVAHKANSFAVDSVSRFPIFKPDENPPEGLESVVWSFLNRRRPPFEMHDSLMVEKEAPKITPQIIQDEVCMGYNVTFHDVLEPDFFQTFQFC